MSQSDILFLENQINSKEDFYFSQSSIQEQFNLNRNDTENLLQNLYENNYEKAKGLFQVDYIKEDILCMGYFSEKFILDFQNENLLNIQLYAIYGKDSEQQLDQLLEKDNIIIDPQNKIYQKSQTNENKTFVEDVEEIQQQQKQKTNKQNNFIKIKKNNKKPEIQQQVKQTHQQQKQQLQESQNQLKVNQEKQIKIQAEQEQQKKQQKIEKEQKQILKKNDHKQQEQSQNICVDQKINKLEEKLQKQIIEDIDDEVYFGGKAGVKKRQISEIEQNTDKNDQMNNQPFKIESKIVKKRRRVVKTIQFQDEDGFLVDKNVSEYEEYEEVQNSFQQQFQLKDVKKNKGSKGNQGNLQSFFNKK